MSHEILLTCNWKWEANLTFMWLGNPMTKRKADEII